MKMSLAGPVRTPSLEPPQDLNCCDPGAHPGAIEFERYHTSRQLDLIGLAGPEEWTQCVTAWQSDDFRLRQAADTLLEALKNAVEVLASVNSDRK